MPARLLLLLSLLAVTAGALWRWHHQTTRPLHADEAVQAWQTWRLLQGEGYRYDPVDRHGPWLYYSAAAVEWLRGGDASTLSAVRVRTFTWLAGVATLLLVALAGARWLGAAPAALATVLLAVAPLAVLYHTYFVQEAWLALFTWVLFFAALAWLQSPRRRWALLAGAAAGLMQVTKETSVLHFAALAAAFLVARPAGGPGETGPGSAGRRRWSHVLAAGGVALTIYLLFYSGFGRHPEGLLDGIRTYLHQWQRAGDDTHSYPPWHYLALLLPHQAGGLRWGEPALLAFALAGVCLALRRRSPPAWRAVAVFTLLLLLIYSAIPYKTPWLLLTPVIGLALLAGQGLVALQRVQRWGLPLLIACAAVTTAQLVDRTRLALDRYPGDARNPYFYQQTPRGFTRLVDRLDQLMALDSAGPEGALRLAVVSPDYAWPLPWHLRDHAATGYFTTSPTDPAAFDILVWDSRVPAPPAWPEGAVVELHGLRPNVLLQLVIRPEWWTRWEAAQ